MSSSPMPRLVSSVLLSVLAVVVVAVPTANATPADCWETWEDLASWTVRVQQSGVSPALLTELDDLTPALDRCDDADALAVRQGMGAEADIWRPLVGVYFDADDVDRVMCLMDAESGGNPNARNETSGAAGLMQVLPSWAEVFGYEVDDLYDPGVNLWIASQLQERYGWFAWSPFQRGSCQ